MLGRMHHTDIVFLDVVQTSTLQYSRVPTPLPSRPLGVTLGASPARRFEYAWSVQRDD